MNVHNMRRNDTAQSRYRTDDDLFHYVGCGLDNVYLKGGVNFSPNGSYSISNLAQLHECLALCIVKYTSLMTGKEFRFLRKELKLSQQALASKLKVDAQTVARWEKGDPDVEPRADRLLRIFFLIKNDSDNKIKALGDLLDGLDDFDIDVSAHRQWKFEQLGNWKSIAS